VVEASAVRAEAIARAAEIASLAPLAIRGMRASFEALLLRRAELDAVTTAALALLREEAWRSDDAAEARAAFAAKRPPAFRGR
jgi:1,4-dihydroxy-2-naphthoyl-CoA synthase